MGVTLFRFAAIASALAAVSGGKVACLQEMLLAL